MDKATRDKLAKRKKMTSKDRVNEIFGIYAKLSQNPKDQKLMAQFSVLCRNIALKIGYHGVMSLYELAGNPKKQELHKFMTNDIKKYQYLLKEAIIEIYDEAGSDVPLYENFKTNFITILDGGNAGKNKKNYQLINDNCNSNVKVKPCCLEKMKNMKFIDECCVGVFKKTNDGRISLGYGLYKIVHDKLVLDYDIKKSVFERLKKEKKK